MKRSMLAGLGVLLLAGTVQASTYDQTPTDDRIFDASQGYLQTGNSLTVTAYIQAQYALLKFDLAGVPDSAVFQSASFSLYQATNTGSTNLQCDLYRAANDAWDESDPVGTAYSLGDVSFLASTINDPWGQYHTWDIDLAAWNYADDLVDDQVTLYVRFQAEPDGFYRSTNFTAREDLANKPAHLVINYVPEPAAAGLAAIGALMLMRRRRAV